MQSGVHMFEISPIISCTTVVNMSKSILFCGGIVHPIVNRKMQIHVKGVSYNILYSCIFNTVACIVCSIVAT